MHISDSHLAEIDEQGFTLVEQFLTADEVAAARAALWFTFPEPEDYFANPAAHEHLTRHQFSGLKVFPFVGWDLNRLAFHPDLVDAAERYLGTTDLDLYKIEAWGKYSGSVAYDQPHHRDFGNHSIVVPRADGAYRQLTTFILLSDVTEEDGPTRLVPLEHTRDVPFIPPEQAPFFLGSVPFGRFADVEVPAVGPAGSLLMYRTDVFHRGSNFTGEQRARFALLADYTVRGAPFTGKVAWPNQANHPCWPEVMERATVRERELFGFPAPGDPYWNEQTVRDVGARYPAMDMSPYGDALG